MPTGVPYGCQINQVYIDGGVEKGSGQRNSLQRGGSVEDLRYPPGMPNAMSSANGRRHRLCSRRELFVTK